MSPNSRIPVAATARRAPAPRAAGDVLFDDPPPPAASTPAQPPVEDVSFSRGAARRPVQSIADPLLQWASGLPTSSRTIYAGWLVEAGKDEALDQAMDAAGFTTITIKHGSGNLVTHWAVETATVFIVADGVQSIGEMKHTSERYGIAFGWRTLPGGRQQSQLRVRVLLRELLAVGYTEPLLLTVKGTLTGDLITALMRQYDVLDENAALRKAVGKEPWDLPLYAFSIPLSAGAEVTRGNGAATKEITPMVAAIPEQITKDYLKAHWIGRAWVEVVERLVEPAIAWSSRPSPGRSVRVCRSPLGKTSGRRGTARGMMDRMCCNGLTNRGALRRTTPDRCPLA